MFYDWFHFRDDNTERNLLEMMVLLVLVIVMDPDEIAKEYMDDAYFEHLEYEKNAPKQPLMFCDTKIQNMVDELALAAGRRTFIEMCTERRAREAATRISEESKKQNNSLVDLITVAVAEKETQERYQMRSMHSKKSKTFHQDFRSND